MRSEDFEWFTQNHKKLFEQYGRCYLIIHDKTVVDTASTVRKGVDKAIELYPDGDYNVQLCDGTEDAFTNFVSSWQLAVI